MNNMPVPVNNYLEYYTLGSERRDFIILGHSNSGNFTFTNWSTWVTLLILIFSNTQH